MAVNELYSYRPDGWPLCPQCGEDELYSIAPLPSPADFLRCLNCNWSGDVPLRDELDLEFAEEDDDSFTRFCACGCSEAEHDGRGCLFCGPQCEGFTYDPDVSLLHDIFDEDLP